jgi:hypothetical protein
MVIGLATLGLAIVLMIVGSVLLPDRKRTMEEA